MAAISLVELTLLNSFWCCGGWYTFNINSTHFSRRQRFALVRFALPLTVHYEAGNLPYHSEQTWIILGSRLISCAFET